VTIAGPLWCPAWCRLVTLPTDPFTTFTSPTDPFLSEWAKCQPGNTQNGGTVLPIANLMADSESGNPSSYSSFIVTIRLCLSRFVLEIFVCDRQMDRQTDNADHYYSHIVMRQCIIQESQYPALMQCNFRQITLSACCVVRFSRNYRPLTWITFAGFLFGLITGGINSTGALWGVTDSWPTTEMQSR